MKKILCLLFAGWCISAFSDGEYREFTDTEGRTISAKIVKVNAEAGKITLEREGQRQANTVPIAVFSKGDQAYIKEWLLAQNFLSSSKLRVSVVKRKGKAEEQKSQEKRPKSPCYYEINLSNQSGAELSGIQVAYCIYMVRDAKDGSVTTVEHDRTGNIILAINGKHELKTKSLTPYRYYNKQKDSSTDEYGRVTYDTSYNKLGEDEVEGIRVRLYMKTASGSEFVREISEPESIKTKYPWQNG